MEFLLIASAHFLALLSPGPDFFLIMQTSLRLPFRFGIALCGGIAMANAIYLALAVSGLEIVRELPTGMILLRYLGAAYLVFIGVSLLRAPRQEPDTGSPKAFFLEPHAGRQFLSGFMSGILNPKNAIFYLSLFTVIVSPETGFDTRCLYGLWMTSVVFAWDCAVVLVIGQDRVKTWIGRGIFYIEKISGALLTMFGLFLPFT